MKERGNVGRLSFGLIQVLLISFYLVSTTIGCLLVLIKTHRVEQLYVSYNDSVTPSNVKTSRGKQ